MTGEWPSLEGLDWPRNHGTVDDFPDEFGEVRVVDPVAAQQARRLPAYPDNPSRGMPGGEWLAEDDGARLDTPENHRAKGIEKMTAELNKAIERGEKAKAWGISIGIEHGFISKLNQALDKLVDAADDIERFHR